jgi:DNA-binding transcriptional ArsR family regulator
MRADSLSATFAALADPTRRAILARLVLGEASVGAIAEPFELSLPTISRHLTVLEEARLIERHKDAQWRRCRLRPESLLEAASWIERYRAFWEGRLDALARYLDGTAARRRAKGARRRPRRRGPRGGRKGVA